MIYRPVVDRIAVAAPLDPFFAVLFVAVFAGAALLTRRRPAYGLCALILSAPFALAHDVMSTTVTLPKCVLLGVLLGLTARAGALGALRRRPVRLLLGALAVYAGATALTLFDASHAGAALRETLKWLEYALTFAAAACCYALDPDDAALAGAATAAAMLVALSALVQEFAGAPSGLFVGAAIVPRIAGVLEGPNQLSAYCAIAFATLFAWRVVRAGFALSAAMALVVATDVLTLSRAGIVALILAAAVLALWAGPRALRAWRPAALGAAAGFMACLWWAIYAHTPGVLRVSLAESAYAGGVGNRDELWRAAWRMFTQRPLLGVGAGNYELELPEYGVYGVRTHANSWYLQSLAEGGIVLFAATLALATASIGAFVKRPLARLRAQSPWVVAALAASVALVFHQVVDDFVFYPKVGTAWFLLLGIAAAAVAP